MQEIVIDLNYNNCRLDRFLKEKFNLPHSLICRSLRNKDILVNSKKALQNSRIFTNDIIQINKDLIQDKVSVQNVAYIPNNLIDMIKNAIIYADDKIIVINKPYGISVQRGGNIKYSVIDILKTLFDENVRIVHRIDKDTTGLIVFAKNKVIATILSEKFRECEVKKEYLAVLDGISKSENGEIVTKTSDFYCKKSNNSKAVLDDNGDIGISHYKIIKINEKLNKSIALFYPKTGKMHQIRIHAKQISNGIYGDEKYNKNFIKGQKLHLFAQKITIDGFGGFELEKLPDHIQKTIANF